MTRTCIQPPEALPVTLDQIRAHLRIDGEAQDSYLLELAEAATALVEAESGKLMITQSWRVFLDEWPESAVVELPLAPVRAVSAFTVYGQDDSPLAVAPESWHADLISEPARLAGLASIYSFRKINGFEIDLLCGYGDTATEVPDQLIRAVLLAVAHWFEFAGAPQDVARRGVLPSGFDRLLAPYRMARL
jgi:uncharacterized phiE125 gp8 family phage protein